MNRQLRPLTHTGNEVIYRLPKGGSLIRYENGQGCFQRWIWIFVGDLDAQKVGDMTLEGNTCENPNMSMKVSVKGGTLSVQNGSQIHTWNGRKFETQM